MANPYICPLSDDEVIDVILSVGERVSDVTLYAYQRAFARRIIESVVKKDAATITALFSRQCVVPETRVMTPSGSVPISRLKKGDEVISYANGVLVKDTVQDIWSDRKKVKEIRMSDNETTIATPETRFYNFTSERWDGLSTNKKSLFKRPYLTVNDCELKEGTPTNTVEQKPHDPVKTAQQALLLLFGKESEHEMITQLLGSNVTGLFYHQTGLDVFAEALGISHNETGSMVHWRTITIPSPELDVDYIYTYRKQICDLMFADAQYFKQNGAVINCTSTGVYKDTLKSFLNAMAIDHEIDKDNKRMCVSKNTALLFLLPSLKKSPYYDKIYYDVFHANRMSSSRKVCRQEALDTIDSYRKPAGRQGRIFNLAPTGKAISIGSFAREIIQRFGYNEWLNIAPDWQYVKVTDVSRTRMDVTYDMETTYTGNYFANDMLVHNCGKSESLKIAVLGLILWMPALCKTYPQDKRFERFNGGFWVGLFAPNLKTQVKSIYNRIRNTLKSKHGKAFMAGIDADFTVNQAFEFVLDTGSRVYGGAASLNANIESQTFHLVIGDEAQDIDSFKWKKSIVPMTTFTAGSKVLVGTANTVKSNFYEQIQRNKDRQESGGKTNHFQVDFTVPSAENPDYALSVKEAIAELGFESDEFQMAYNNQFIFSRGMAVDPELLNFHSDRHPRGVIYPHEYVTHYTGENKVVVGVDIGKKHDPTVCTAVEVDVSAPIDIVHFRTFKKKEIAKMELLGDDIEAQVPQILDFIQKMRATTVIVDATGGGDHFFDMLSKRLPQVNWIPFVFSQKSRSELWKAFLSDLSTGRVQLAGGKETQETVEYYKTIKELSELEKHYNGQYLACQAPNSRNAHDDYAVSLALACYACKDYFVGELTVTEGFFKNRRKKMRSKRRTGRFR